ncbi:MAG TPA: cytochrome c biogenesis protein ResB, partial [Streptosporangiaceae bacterium]
MTDVHTPEADPAGTAGPAATEADPALDPALGERDAADAPVERPAVRAGHFGAVAWARWGWRQLTSMRVALVLLFLLALGSVPGSLLPQQGIDPAAVQQYYDGHP